MHYISHSIPPPPLHLHTCTHAHSLTSPSLPPSLSLPAISTPHSTIIVSKPEKTVSSYVVVTECIVCVLGQDPLTFSFLSFSFLIAWEFYGPSYLSVKICALGPPRPLSPSAPAVAGRQLVIV